MHKKLLILCLLLTGCSLNRIIDVELKGKNVKTPYGKGENLEIKFTKYTIFSSCKKTDNVYLEK